MDVGLDDEVLMCECCTMQNVEGLARLGGQGLEQSGGKGGL